MFFANARSLSQTRIVKVFFTDLVFLARSIFDSISEEKAFLSKFFRFLTLVGAGRQIHQNHHELLQDKYPH